MNQKEVFDVLLGKTYFDDEQSLNYRVLINCIANIIMENYKNKLIDKDIIE